MLARWVPLVFAHTHTHTRTHTNTHTHQRRATNHHVLHQLSPWQRGRRTWQSSPLFSELMTSSWQQWKVRVPQCVCAPRTLWNPSSDAATIPSCFAPTLVLSNMSGEWRWKLHSAGTQTFIQWAGERFLPKNLRSFFEMLSFFFKGVICLKWT